MNLKIDPFSSPPPNHTLWIPWPRAHLSCIGWVQVGGAPTPFKWVPIPSTFVFFAPTPFLPFLPCFLLLHILCPCLSSTIWRPWALGLASFPLISLWAWIVCWQKSLLTQLTRLLLLLFFFSCHVYGPASYHSYHASPLGLLPLYLGFLGPLTLLLLLVVHIGLLVVMSAMLAYWACYLFPWAS